MSEEPNIAVFIALVAHGMFCEKLPLPWEASHEADFQGIDQHAWCLRDASGQAIAYVDESIDLPSIVDWINTRGTLTAKNDLSMSSFIQSQPTPDRNRDHRVTPRHEQLRRQAEQLCERRTIERDEARAALAHQAEDAELGRALRDLVTQLRRLRRYRIPGHVWSPSGVISSLFDELNELDSEDPNSLEAMAEALDVMCVSLQLMITFNIDLIKGFTRAAEKLDRRLAHIDTGGTWASAKELERGEI